MIGPGGLALIGLGILTIPIWGPFASNQSKLYYLDTLTVGYGSYLAVIKAKEVDKKTVLKV